MEEPIMPPIILTMVKGLVMMRMTTWMKEEFTEEMDGGTDYASNYFDNGEGFGDDEDDNLDEG